MHFPYLLREKKIFIKESVICHILSNINEIDYYKIKINSGIFYYLDKIQNKVRESTVKEIEENFFFKEKTFEIDKNVLKKYSEDFSNIKKLINNFEQLETEFQRKILKLLNTFPLAQKVLGKEINLTDSLKEFRLTPIDKFFKFIKTTINTTRSNLEMIIKYNQSIK